MIWSVVTDVAAVITVLGLPYLVVSNRRRSPKFSFAFAGGSREFFDRDGMDWCRMRFSGLVRNQSTDPNSIARIHLVVWTDKKKRSTRTFGYIPAEICENGSQVKLPISFDPRQGRQLALTYEIVLTGSHEMEIATAQERQETRVGRIVVSAGGTPRGVAGMRRHSESSSSSRNV